MQDITNWTKIHVLYKYLYEYNTQVDFVLDFRVKDIEFESQNKHQP